MDILQLNQKELKENEIAAYNILRVDTGTEKSASINSGIADLVVEKARQRIAGSEVTSRFLGRMPVEEINKELFDSMCSEESSRTENESKAVKIAHTMITELLEADVILFNVPVYPFGVQKNFKAYLDIVLRCGRSRFDLRADMKSKLSDKKVILVTNDIPLNNDSGENYAQYLLKFLGITGAEVFSISRNAKSGDVFVKAIEQQIEQELLV